MSIRLSSSVAFLGLSFFLALPALAQAILTIAAAADLSTAESDLVSAFEQTNPSIKVRFVTGAHAALAQQIQQGAPFDIFLSANTDLVDQLHLYEPKTYAVGHVAILWKDNKPHNINDLIKSEVRFVALPNPLLAPYGLAAKQALQRSGLWEKLQPKIVYGENVRQTLQLFDSGNADAAFTAASLVIDRHSQLLPTAVVQRGGIVHTTKEPHAAHLFMQWLLSQDAQQILSRFGFSKP